MEVDRRVHSEHSDLSDEEVPKPSYYIRTNTTFVLILSDNFATGSAKCFVDTVNVLVSTHFEHECHRINSLRCFTHSVIC